MTGRNAVAAPSHVSETRRLDALRRLALLDTPNEPAFDDLTQLAATALDTPIALVSLIDGERQWFKSRVGLTVRETARELAFCAHAIESDDVLEVPDASADARFATNPLVTGTPHIRFYAGAPLKTIDGYRVGTLCVIDQVPRRLSQGQRDLLAGLARQVMRQCEWRRLAMDNAAEAAFHAAMVRGAGLAVIATTPEGLITRFNPAAERLLGWSAAEVVGVHTSLQFHDPTELDACAARLSELWRQPTAAGPAMFAELIRRNMGHAQEWTYVRRDGRRVPVSLTLSAVHDDDGRLIGYLGLADDVTERRAAQEQLRLSEGKFRALSVSAPVGIFQTDPSGACVYTNERWQAIAGLGAAEALGHGWAEAIAPEDRRHVFEAWVESARERVDFDHEFRMGQGDGARWVHSRARAIVSDDGAVIGHVGTVEDVTERKRQNAALQQQVAAMEAAVDGMALLDEQGHFVSLNAAHISLFGYEQAAELVGASWRTLYDEAEVHRLEAEAFPILQRDSQWQGEALARRRDGTSFHEGLSLTLLPQGGLVCVCRDISRRKSNEQRLVASVHEKDLLLQEIHHRVKNNLQIISSLLYFQSKDVQHPADRAAFDNGRDRLQSMILVHDALYRSGDLSHVDLAEYLRTLVGHLAVSLQRTNSCHVRVEGKAITVDMQRALPLGMIASELVTNIYKYAFPAGGTGHAVVCVSEDAAGIRLVVADQGVGIPAHVDLHQSVSFGWRLIPMLATQLGATVSYTSGPGTTVTVSLPSVTAGTVAHTLT